VQPESILAPGPAQQRRTQSPELPSRAAAAGKDVTAALADDEDARVAARFQRILESQSLQKRAPLLVALFLPLLSFPAFAQLSNKRLCRSVVLCFILTERPRIGAGVYSWTGRDINKQMLQTYRAVFQLLTLGCEKVHEEPLLNGS